MPEKDAISHASPSDDRGEIDALRREVERLRAVNRQLGLVLDGVVDGLLVQDRSGRVTYANRAAAELLGAGSVEAMVGAQSEQLLGPFELYDEKGRSFAGENLPGRRVLAGETAEPATIRFREREAEVDHWFALTATATRDERGAVAQAITFFREVTDAKRTQDALRLSEARLATTLNSIGDAVIATDGAGRVTFMNPVAESLTGFSYTRSFGLPLRDVFPALDPETLVPAPGPFEQVLRRRGVVAHPSGTSVLPRASGNVVVAHSAAPIWDEHGELAGVVLVFRDVTRERHARQREDFLAHATAILSSSLEYADTLTSLARLAVPKLADWCTVEVLDPQGRLQPLAFAHADPAQVARAHAHTARYPSNPQAPYGAPNVVRTGRAELMPHVSDEILVASAADPEHLALLRGAGVGSYMCVPLAARGRMLGAITFIGTGARRRFDELDLAFAEELGRRAGLAIDNARLYHDAQDASRLRDEFLATVSHELRTPLTAILGWVHILKSREPEPGSLERGLHVIERNARAQAQLIEDLLDTSRIISGKLRLELRVVDAVSVVAAAVEVVRPAADAKGVQIETDLSTAAGSVYADPDRLQQVAWNLLSNAVKFTPRGGTVRAQLTRVATDNGQGIELRVSDTGEGIRPEFLMIIFERFRQADSSPTRKQGGLGLGLAIVRHLVELHGGTVRAESAGVGHGATFVVWLPGALRMPAEPERAGIEGTPTARDERDGRLRGLRVLVIDDEPDARELLEMVLSDAGADVTTAGDAIEGLARVQSVRPDVLVSDIGMPETDGYALARALRVLSPEKGGATPAVALTAYARTEDAQRALDAGYQRHVTKPVDPNRLIDVVAELGGLRPRSA